MNGYDGDPIGPHARLRIVSVSPEDVFHRCPFSGDHSDSDSSEFEAFRVQSTGIFMVSLPDTLEEKDDSNPHLYQTPPEELAPVSSDGQRSAAVDVYSCEDVAADANAAEVTVECMDDENAVDLGRDTDVALYSEVQPTSETGEKDKSVEIIGVCRSQISGSEAKDLGRHESLVSLGESSSKRLKLSEEFPVDSKKSGGAKVVLASSVSHNSGEEASGGKCKLKAMDDGKVSNGDSVEIHCNYKEKSAEKEERESVKNSQPDEPSNFQEEMANRHQSSRVLPPSISGVMNNAGKKSNNSDESKEVTLLDILKILKVGEESEFDDESLSKLSILDIVQRRGMTFPRPEWWPPEA